jgi:pyruvate dehydrogenase E1 component alpha subunit
MGHYAPDKAGYRDAEDHAARIADDPIARWEAVLRERGVPGDAFDAAREEARRETAADVEAARAAPTPALREAFTDVQDVGAPQELARA